MKINAYRKRTILSAAMPFMVLFASCAAVNANTKISPSPRSVIFGTQSVGTTSAPVNVTLKNNSGHRIIIAGISSSGAQFSYFWPSVPFTLDPSQQLTGTVTFTPAAAQNYNGALTFTPANGPSVVVSLTGTGTAAQTQPLPVIQPISETVAAGQTATFSATVSGGNPISYQWKKNGAAINGATAAGYTTPATITSDNGAQFTVTVSTSTGSASSKPATLAVIANVVAPSITTQLASQTVTAGQTASFYVATTGTTPLSYQWRKNGTSITGATSSTYTTPVTTTSDNGSQFTVMASNTAGNVTSNAATLTVNAAPAAPAITTQPVSQTVTAGQTASFSATATGTAPLSYQWRKNGTSITGATSSTYTTPVTTTSDNGSQFTVMASNTAGNVTSNTATLTVNATTVAPAITNQPVSQTVTAGQTATFSATATGSAPLSYQWRKNGTSITGATSSTYTTPVTTTSDNGSQFTVMASNTAGNVTSSAATLTVSAPPGQLTASPLMLSFGNVNVGTSSTQNITLTNNSSSGSITVSAITISGPFAFTGVTLPVMLNPAQSLSLHVTFTPTVSGTTTEMLTVTSTAGNSPTTITLVGSSSSLSPSGPIVINGQNGTVIQGLAVTSTIGDCVQITNSSNITIQNSEIGPCGANGVKISGGSGINVFDSYIHPETLSPGCCDHNDGIFASGTSSLVIQGNVIAYSESNIEVAGSGAVTVTGNFLLNPRGPKPRGQNFQAWNGNSNVIVQDNYALSSTDTTKYKFAENQEDSINFGFTNGIIVQNNYVTGGHSPSGCGIIADDSANNAQFKNNRLLNTGQCGVSIADGTTQLVDSNKIYNTTPVVGGGNTAIMTWKQYANPCGPTTVSNNIADEIKPDGSHSGFWDGGGCSTTLSGNTFDQSADASLTPTSTVFAPPLIPPQPKNCVVISPYSTQISLPPCVP